MGDFGWWEQAACLGKGIQYFFPETPVDLAQARAICGGCPVRIECLHYAMNLPTSVVITGCDSLPILQQALQTARTFRPLSQEQVAALLAKTEKAAQTGEHELYKTAHNFDGTMMNPQWLE